MRQDPPELLAMIAQLIGTPSVSSVTPGLDQGNRAVIDLLAGWLDAAGFEVDVMPLADEPDRANLIATLGRGPGGLVLSGHTDTVPWDDGDWPHDPFALTEADGRLYGRGTADMKAFLGLASEARREIRPLELREPVIILATADEETSMAGARALVERDALHARHALIGEPTGMRPVRMHKGMMMEAIRLHGHAGHSSDPALGKSALEAMHRVITALLAWRQELQATWHDPLFAVPVPTMNLGHIHGGAFGGGVGLACVCDVAIADEGTRFGLTETRLGLIPATIGPYVIARLGEGPARRVFMSSRLFDASEAVTLGLVKKAVPAEALKDAVRAEAAPYLKVAPGAVGRAKALARRLGPVIDDAVIDDTIERLADAWETDEAREGIAAFLEKRPPRWAT